MLNIGWVEPRPNPRDTHPLPPQGLINLHHRLKADQKPQITPRILSKLLVIYINPAPTPTSNIDIIIRQKIIDYLETGFAR